MSAGQSSCRHAPKAARPACTTSSPGCRSRLQGENPTNRPLGRPGWEASRSFDGQERVPCTSTCGPERLTCVNGPAEPPRRSQENKVNVALPVPAQRTNSNNLSQRFAGTPCHTPGTSLSVRAPLRANHIEVFFFSLSILPRFLTTLVVSKDPRVQLFPLSKTRERVGSPRLEEFSHFLMIPP